MKETVLSAKTSGTARKRFEVIVEVIKKNPPPNFFFFFFHAALFLLSRNLFGFRRAGHIYVYVIAQAGVIFRIYFTSCRYSDG